MTTTMQTNAQCADWGDKIRQQADAFYDHYIRETETLIADARKRGQDPTKVPLADGIATVDYEKDLRRTREAKTAAYQQADQQTASCNAGAIPDWLGDAQKALDFAMTLAVIPYTAVIKDFAAVGIDLGEVYKGRMFGGGSALIPKARDDAFAALGIGGDAAKFIADPVNSVRDALVDAGKVVGGAAAAAGAVVDAAAGAVGGAVAGAAQAVGDAAAGAAQAADDILHGRRP